MQLKYRSIVPAVYWHTHIKTTSHGMSSLTSSGIRHWWERFPLVMLWFLFIHTVQKAHLYSVFTLLYSSTRLALTLGTAITKPHTSTESGGWICRSLILFWSAFEKRKAGKRMGVRLFLFCKSLQCWLMGQFSRNHVFSPTPINSSSVPNFEELSKQKTDI